MGAPRFVQPRPASPAGSSASVALWLGIGSIVACVISVGLLALPALAAGIGAVVVGSRARARGGGSGGIITGAIGIVLSVLALLLWIALLVVGGLTLEFLDVWGEFEDWLETPPGEGPEDPDRRVI